MQALPSFGTREDGGDGPRECRAVRSAIAAIPAGCVLAYGDAPTAPPHLAAEQLSRLRAESVLAEGGRVPMRRYYARS